MSRLKPLAVAYVACAGVFLAMDAVWLTAAAERLYRPRIGALMAAEVRPVPALAFYAIYIAGVVAFAIAPSLREGRIRNAAIRGAGLGFLAYATYDLTNQATLKVWSTLVTVLDLAWGAFATGVAALAAAAIVARVLPESGRRLGR
jgi:uncharacterized membrane protein